jgi:hypothetical protein
MRNEAMKKLIYIAAVATGLVFGAAIAQADETRVGVGVGPVGAGVTVGQSHERRTTVIREREREPRDAVVIRKEHREPRDKVIIHEHEHDHY